MPPVHAARPGTALLSLRRTMASNEIAQLNQDPLALSPSEWYKRKTVDKGVAGWAANFSIAKIQFLNLSLGPDIKSSKRKLELASATGL
jgi:hypothetical protein